MATIQSTGIGSGLDIESLVEKLVAAERAPADAQITRRESKATLQISALANLKSVLSSFKTAVEPLKNPGTLNPHSATSSDEDVLTATASGSAATGNYHIEVIELAQAHQLASSPFQSSSTVVGTGTLTITQGGKSFNIVVDSTNSTLAGIRDSINKATGNTGVQATIINEVNGSRLLLSSAKTGASQGIEITRSGGNGGLDQLVYDPGTLTNLTQLQGPQDAHLRVGGITGFHHYSASNSVTGLVDGLTINLKGKTEANTPLTINVANDTAKLTESVGKFVEAYNSLNSAISSLRSYDATTRKAGPLLGDAMLRGIEERLRSNLVNPVAGLSGTYTTLAAIGVTKQADGSLQLDADKLKTALETDRNSVVGLFGSTNGVATRLFKDVEAQLTSGAGLETRNKSLQAEISRVEDDKDSLDTRMALIEERYRKQFTAMDTLLASLNSTSTYLAQQLENLPKPGKG